MTNEDIIRMALEAGGCTPEWDDFWEFHQDALERFASLVAAAEREKVAAWMRSKSYATGHGDTVEDLLKELEWQVAEREREECARVTEDIDIVEFEHCMVLHQDAAKTLTNAAAAIRARGE